MSEFTRHAGPHGFATTQWDIVLRAAENGGTGAQQALSQLCQTYWYPLYAYLRRRGHNPEDAEDLTQAFFLRLLQKNFLEGITQEGGRFRSFLLTALQRFAANEWDRASAQKRGGGARMVSFDGVTAEERYLLEPVEHTTPESLYARRWALTLLEEALTRTQAEFSSAGKATLFETLKPFITGESNQAYSQIAGQLGLTEGAIKVAVHRLRERFRGIMRETVAETLSNPGEIDSEMRFLAAAISSQSGA